MNERLEDAKERLLKLTRRNGSSGGDGGTPEMRAKRDELRKQFVELQWDLGGITYEMAARDHYRLDVLNNHAAKLQEIDSQLGQVERMMKMEESGAAGACPECSALQARGAMFCWQCGKELVQEGKG